MNKNFKSWVSICVILGLMLLPGLDVLAQGGPGNGGPTPVNIPIDGGVSLLVAGGVTYGVNKLRKMRRK